MSDKTTRDHIVEAADQLFYHRGYEHTAFSDIADVVQISRGNFYYYFKTKDEILDAVIGLRLANTRKHAGAVGEGWGTSRGSHPELHPYPHRQPGENDALRVPGGYAMRGTGEA